EGRRSKRGEKQSEEERWHGVVSLDDHQRRGHGEGIGPSSSIAMPHCSQKALLESRHALCAVSLHETYGFVQIGRLLTADQNKTYSRNVGQFLLYVYSPARFNRIRASPDLAVMVSRLNC